MLTWTTYGTWLQGDERGYVKNGRICRGSAALMLANKRSQLQNIVRLSREQQQFVREAIREEARLQGQRIYALSVKATHAHIVVDNTSQPISRIIAYYKKAGRLALKANGHTGRLWTKGYDKRFCFDRESLGRRIAYVERQDPRETPRETWG